MSPGHENSTHSWFATEFLTGFDNFDFPRLLRISYCEYYQWAFWQKEGDLAKNRSFQAAWTQCAVGVGSMFL